MMLYVILAIIITVIALVAVITALVTVTQSSKKQKEAPELEKNAKVLKTYTKTCESNTVDSANSYTTTKYYIDFKLDDDTKLSFQVKKKLFLQTMDGDRGRLCFKGKKLIDFYKTPSFSEHYDSSEVSGRYFFQKTQKSGFTVKFYADAPGVGVNIPSSKPITCDYSEVCEFIAMLSQDRTDSFFCLENSSGNVIEFSHEGKKPAFDISIPLDGGFAYRGGIVSEEELRECVSTFIGGGDVTGLYHLTREKI